MIPYVYGCPSRFAGRVFPLNYTNHRKRHNAALRDCTHSSNLRSQATSIFLIADTKNAVLPKKHCVVISSVKAMIT